MKTWDLETIEVWLNGPVPKNGIDIARLAETSVPACIKKYQTTLSSHGEVMSLAMLMGVRMHPAKIPLQLVWNHQRIIYEWSQKTTGVVNRPLPIEDEQLIVTLNYAEAHLDRPGFLLRHGDILSLLVEPLVDVKRLKIDLFGVLIDPRSGKPWPDDFTPERVTFGWER